MGAVSWAAAGLSHSGFEHLALCQPGCNPLLPLPVAVVALAWRRKGNSISPYKMSEYLHLCVVSSHVWDLVVKDLPFQPGSTFKPGNQVHKDSTTAGISNHNVYYQLCHELLMWLAFVDVSWNRTGQGRGRRSKMCVSNNTRSPQRNSRLRNAGKAQLFWSVRYKENEDIVGTRSTGCPILARLQGTKVLTHLESVKDIPALEFT